MKKKKVLIHSNFCKALTGFGKHSKNILIHLQKRNDVQNIDLMNLSGFCRNCLSRWYSEAASENGIDLDKDKAREIVYGMPHSVWKDKYQTEETKELKS